MEYHFISGLPRSGSSLLASILRQNPAFQASIMTPLAQIVTSAIGGMGPSNEAAFTMDHFQKTRVARGIVESFYWSERAIEGKIVAFDNNRRWTANAGLVGAMFQHARIICCLRSPNEIVDSFERAFQKNPASVSSAIGGHPNTTIYERVGELMKPAGVVGFALNAFRTAFYGPHRDRLWCMQYDELARYPGDVLKELHSAIKQPWFEYDFKNVEPIPGATAFDAAIHTPGLHSLLPEVKYPPRQSVLPPDVWAGLPTPFWIKEAVTPSV